MTAPDTFVDAKNVLERFVEIKQGFFRLAVSRYARL
jgi:hypothetical protein